MLQRMKRTMKVLDDSKKDAQRWQNEIDRAFPPIPPTTKHLIRRQWIGVVQDPNELIGPSGYGILNFVADGNLLAYEIIFANETNATALRKL